MKEDFSHIEYFERLEKFALSLGYKYDDGWGFPTHDMLREIERLRRQLGRYTQFVLWVEEEHNEVFDEYEGKDKL